MIGRARLTLLLSIVLAAVIVGAELPIGQLVHERAAIAAATTQLRQLQAENRSLGATVRSLGQDSTVAKLAHEQYLLVRPGQRAYVVLPAPSAEGGTPAPLATNPLPHSAIVPSDAQLGPTVPATQQGQQRAQTGLWGQVVNRLEFWRWAF